MRLSERRSLIISLLLIVWGIVHLAIMLRASIRGVTWPLQGFWGDQSGGSQLVFATYIAQGVNYFTDASDYPMLTPQTPGLFPLLLAPIVKLWGPSLLYGNIFGLIAASVTISCVFYLAIRLTNSIPYGFAAIGFLLCFPRLGWGLIAARPDALSYACGIAAVAMIYMSDRQHQSIGLIMLAALFSALSFYAKQNGALSTVAIALYLLGKRQTRPTIWFGATALLFGAAPFALLQYYTHGGYGTCILTFTRGMTVYSFDHWIRHTLLGFLGWWPALSLACFSLARAIRCRRLSVIHAYAIAGWVAGYATVWHTGGSYQYFGWGLTAMAPLAADGLYRILSEQFGGRRKGEQLRWTVLAIVMLWPICTRVVSPWTTLRQTWMDLLAPTQQYMAQTDRIAQRLLQLDGPILTERLSGIEAAQGRKVEVEVSALGRLMDKGVWDSTRFVGDLRRARWNYVLTTSAHNAPFGDSWVFQDALEDGYSPTHEVFELGGFEVVLWQAAR